MFRFFRSFIKELNICVFLWIDVDYDWFLLNWSPTAGCFNSVVVSVHLDSEISWFTPISSPAIPANPVLDIAMGFINSPTQNRDLMVEGGREVSFCKNPSIIRMEPSCCLESAGDWASCVDFCFHLIDSSYRTIFHHSPYRVSILGIAYTCRITIFAPFDISTLRGFINWRVNSLIRLASLFGNPCR